MQFGRGIFVTYWYCVCYFSKRLLNNKFPRKKFYRKINKRIETSKYFMDKNINRENISSGERMYFKVKK